MIEAGTTHVVLLQFVAAEDHQAPWPVFLQHNLDELFSKRTCASRYQNFLIRPIHRRRLVLICRFPGLSALLNITPSARFDRAA
jgi:hypothetical protein